MKKPLFIIAILLLLLLTACHRPTPAMTGGEWLEALPWEEEWTCLLLGDRDPGWELEPETGKAALRALLGVRSWGPMEAPESGEQKPFRLVQLWCGEEGPLTLTLNEQGDACWDGTWHRPLGEDGGAQLLADFLALAETGVNMTSPPVLTLRSGEETGLAYLNGTYSWYHRTRMGRGFGCESDSFLDLTKEDWENTQLPITLLRADGEVLLDFGDARIPDSLSLSAVCPYGSIPVELREGRFTPYAGVNAYVLNASWEHKGFGGSGYADYVLLVEGFCPSPLPEAEIQVELRLLAADSRGCDLTLDPGERSFVIGSDKTAVASHYLLRKTDFGGWEWLKPRRAEEAPRLDFDTGDAAAFWLDWSYTLGDLEPGEYCLLLCGYLGGSYAGDLKYIPLPFTLEPGARPEPPGPMTLQEVPEGIISELYRSSAYSFHRYTQTLTLEGAEKYAVDRGFTLFRLGAEGSLTEIFPAYALPAALNKGANLTAGSLTLDVELAAFYGELPQGNYVLRRRLLRLSKGEKGWDWRLEPPEDRVLYVDTVFRTGGLMAVEGAVEPLLPSPAYDGTDPALPLCLTLGAAVFSASRCRFTVKNLGERTLTYAPEDFTLFYREGAEKEWLPLVRERHKSLSRTMRSLAPGESAELYLIFKEQGYPSLAPGNYRAVLPLEDGAEEGPGWLVAEFTVYGDKTGKYTGERLELEALIRDYARRLGAAYVLPESERTGPLRPLPGQPDPYVGSWRVRPEKDGFVVSVHRDRDVDRAGELLADYDNVRVERGEDTASMYVDTDIEGNLGSRGELRAEAAEQTDERLYPESLWVLTFRWDEEEPYRQTTWGLYLERRVGNTWRAQPSGRGTRLVERDYCGTPLVLEQGENTLIINLGYCYTEFDPAAEYRFVLALMSPEGRLEYYLCPFAISGEGCA